jgi:hypothetical protein
LICVGGRGRGRGSAEAGLRHCSTTQQRHGQLGQNVVVPSFAPARIHLGPSCLSRAAHGVRCTRDESSGFCRRTQKDTHPWRHRPRFEASSRCFLSLYCCLALPLPRALGLVLHFRDEMEGLHLCAARFAQITCVLYAPLLFHCLLQAPYLRLCLQVTLMCLQDRMLRGR